MDVESSASELTYTLTTIPVNGTLKKSNVALVLNDTFTQADIDSSNVSYEHNGSETTADSFGFSISDGIVTLNSKIFNFTITSVNDAPIASSQAVTVTDDANPTAITLIATDVDSSPLTYSIVSNPTSGNVTGSGNAHWSYLPNSYNVTTDQFTFKANDGSLDSNIETVSITVSDWINPIINITTPSANQILASSNVEISGNYSDEKSGINTASANLVINEMGVLGAIVSTTDFSYNLNGSDGHYNAIFYISDNDGNASQDSVLFTIDTVTPTITLTTPVESSWFTEPVLNFSGTFFDQTSGIDLTSAKFWIDDSTSLIQSTSISTTTFSGLTEYLNEGQYTFKAEVSDNGGLTLTTSASFVVNAISPQITFTTPSYGEVFTIGEPLTSITGTLYDFHGIDANSIDIKIDNLIPQGNIITSANAFRVDIFPSTAYGIGVHSIQVFAKDSYGVQSIKSIEYVIINSTNSSGNMAIDGDFSDWSGIAYTTDATGDISSSDVVDFNQLWLKEEGNNIYLSYQTEDYIDLTNHAWRYMVYIDSDQDRSSGYLGLGASYGIGADYLIQGSYLYSFSGNTQTTWSFSNPTVLQNAKVNDRIEYELPRNLIGQTGTPATGFLLEGSNAFISNYMNDSKLGLVFLNDAVQVPEIDIDGVFSDWDQVSFVEDLLNEVGPACPMDYETFWATESDTLMFLSFKINPNDNLQNDLNSSLIFIDSDNNINTGFTGSDASYGLGAEYLLIGATLYNFTGGTSTTWSWSYLGETAYKITGNRIELAIFKSLMSLPATATLKFLLLGNHTTDFDYFDAGRQGYLFKDGTLGHEAVVIDGLFDDWTNVAQSTDASGDVDVTDIVDFKNLWLQEDDSNLYLSYQTEGNIDFANHAWRYSVFIDADNNRSSGYIGLGSNYGIGADYVILGSFLYTFTGNTQTIWSFSNPVSLPSIKVNDRVEYAFPKSLIGQTGLSTTAFLLEGSNALVSDYLNDNKLGIVFSDNEIQAPNIVLDGLFSDWDSVYHVQDQLDEVGPSCPIDYQKFWVSESNSRLYLSFLINPNDNLQNDLNDSLIFIDTDNDLSTGYIGGTGTYGLGAEYLLIGASLYSFTGLTNTTWSFAYESELPYKITNNQIEFVLFKDEFALPDQATLKFLLLGNHLTDFDYFDPGLQGYLFKDGRLGHESIVVDGFFEDWNVAQFKVNDSIGEVNASTNIDFKSLSVDSDAKSLFIQHESVNPISSSTSIAVYIDTDLSGNGYSGGNTFGMEADYLLSNSILYEYTGINDSWSWNSVGQSFEITSGNNTEMILSKSDLQITTSTNIKLLLHGFVDSNEYDYLPNIGSPTNYVPDTVLPSITITNPENGQSFPIGSFSISGNLSDFGSGINPNTIKLVIDGSTPSGVIASTTNFSYNYTGTEGIHNITAYISDHDNNTAETSISFNIDYTTPSINITTPMTSSLLTDNTPYFSGTLSDSLSGIDTNRVHVFIDGTTQSGITVTTSSFSGTANPALSDGTHTLEVLAVDFAGWVGAASISFDLDATGPTITFTTPSDGSIYTTTNPAMYISGTLYDEHGVDANSIDVVINNSTPMGNVLTSSNTFSIDIFHTSSYGEGIHFVHVTAKDLLGNENTEKLAYGITDQELYVPDYDGPVITVNSPQNFLITNSTEVSVSANITDAFEVFIGSNVITGMGNTFSSNVELNEGINDISIRARDDHLNWTYADLKVTLDTDPPGLVLENPVRIGETYVTGGDSVYLEGEVFDPHISHIKVSTEGGFINVTPNDIEFSCKVTISTSTTSISLEAFDLAGNSKVESFNIQVDHNNAALLKHIIEPYSIGLGGGDNIRLVGENFRTGMTGNVGSTFISNLILHSEKEATFILPSTSSFGSTMLSIQNISGNTDSSSQFFNYIQAFEVTNLSDGVNTTNDNYGITANIIAHDWSVDTIYTTVVGTLGVHNATNYVSGNVFSHLVALDEGENEVTFELENTSSNYRVQRKYRIEKDTGGTLTHAPDAEDDEMFLLVNGNVSLNVLSNDEDKDGDSFSITSFTQGGNGTVSNLGNGTLKYTANNNFEGIDTFSYTIEDTSSLSNSAKVEVHVSSDPLTGVITSFKQALVGGNITNIVSHFEESAKPDYIDIFTEISSSLSDVANDFDNIYLVKMQSGVAIYEMIVNENGEHFLYQVQLVLDENGEWKISSL